MAIPLHVFREYDIRGLVATELTPEFAGQLGRGFGQYLLEKNHNHRSDNPASVALV
jgi:phosphomannomutase